MSFGNQKGIISGGVTINEINGAVMTDEVLSQYNVAAMSLGESVPAGTTLQQFVEQLLAGNVFNPALYVPLFTATAYNPGGDNTLLTLMKEVGTLLDFKVLFGFSRGSIIGKLISGVWQSATFQDYRSGTLETFRLTGAEADLGTATRFDLAGVAIATGANLFEFFADYNAGAQPTNSAGDNYSTPLAAGSLQSDVTIEGVRAAFFGADSNPAPASTSAMVRALDSSLLNPQSGSTFTINIEAGDSRVTFAYPKTIGSYIVVIDVEGMGLNIADSFTMAEVEVEGANGYAAITYYVCSLIPDMVYSGTRTYNVTIADA